MKTTLFLWLGIFLAPALTAAPAEFHARKVVDHLVSVEHAKANDALLELENKYPRYPLSGFYRATTTWAKAQDKSNKHHDQLQQQSIYALKEVITDAEKALTKTPQDRDWKMSLGVSHIFIARIYLQQSRWIKAYRHIRKGRDELRKLLHQHPDYADAWFTLGLYEYYTGSVPKHLKWLTKIIDLSGDRTKGIEYIKRSVKDAAVASPEAARILLDEINPPDCGNLALAKQLRDTYANNPQFSELVQRLHVYCGYPETALKEIKLIKANLPQHYKKFEGSFYLLKLAALASMGDYEKIEQDTNDHPVVKFYLARALDVAKKREQALQIYSLLKDNEALKPWQQQRVERYLTSAYRRPATNKNTDNGLRITLAKDLYAK